jgi:hypothetical protein
MQSTQLYLLHKSVEFMRHFSAPLVNHPQTC